MQGVGQLETNAHTRPFRNPVILASFLPNLALLEFHGFELKEIDSRGRMNSIGGIRFRNLNG